MIHQKNINIAGELGPNRRLKRLKDVNGMHLHESLTVIVLACITNEYVIGLESDKPVKFQSLEKKQKVNVIARAYSSLSTGLCQFYQDAKIMQTVDLDSDEETTALVEHWRMHSAAKKKRAAHRGQAMPMIDVADDEEEDEEAEPTPLWDEEDGNDDVENGQEPQEKDQDDEEDEEDDEEEDEDEEDDSDDGKDRRGGQGGGGAQGGNGNNADSGDEDTDSDGNGDRASSEDKKANSKKGSKRQGKKKQRSLMIEECGLCWTLLLLLVSVCNIVVCCQGIVAIKWESLDESPFSLKVPEPLFGGQAFPCTMHDLAEEERVMSNGMDCSEWLWLQKDDKEEVNMDLEQYSDCEKVWNAAITNVLSNDLRGHNMEFVDDKWMEDKEVDAGCDIQWDTSHFVKTQESNTECMLKVYEHGDGLTRIKSDEFGVVIDSDHCDCWISGDIDGVPVGMERYDDCERVWNDEITCDIFNDRDGLNMEYVDDICMQDKTVDDGCDIQWNTPHFLKFVESEEDCVFKVYDSAEGVTITKIGDFGVRIDSILCDSWIYEVIGNASDLRGCRIELKNKYNAKMSRDGDQVMSSTMDGSQLEMERYDFCDIVWNDERTCDVDIARRGHNIECTFDVCIEDKDEDEGCDIQWNTETEHQESASRDDSDEFGALSDSASCESLVDKVCVNESYLRGYRMELIHRRNARMGRDRIRGVWGNECGGHPQRNACYSKGRSRGAQSECKLIKFGWADEYDLAATFEGLALGHNLKSNCMMNGCNVWYTLGSLTSNCMLQMHLSVNKYDLGGRSMETGWSEILTKDPSNTQYELLRTFDQLGIWSILGVMTLGIGCHES